MRYSEADIQEFIHDNDVKFIKFSFCDVFGNQKIISVLPRAFSQGIAVDASRIEGFYKRGDSELFLFPDTDTISLLPWRPSHGRVARFYCHIKDQEGSPFAQDGRKILRDAVAWAKDRGIEVNFGAENDFYLFRTDEEGAVSYTHLVLLTGEISDELFGYKYTDFAPSAQAFQEEAQKRVRELHMYDVLRCLLYTSRCV